jgi:uncharacterized protein (TIGR00369 family)
MNQTLTLKFEQIVKQASSQDLQVLTQLIEGIERKQAGVTTTYLDSSLFMNRSLTEDSCTITIPITPFIHNNLGIPHGGILAVLLDTAMGVLVNQSLTTGFSAVTMNLSIHYLAVANGPYLDATASFVHRGRQTMVIEGVVTDQSGKRLAIATGSFFVIPVQPK